METVDAVQDRPDTHNVRQHGFRVRFNIVVTGNGPAGVDLEPVARRLVHGLHHTYGCVASIEGALEHGEFKIRMLVADATDSLQAAVLASTLLRSAAHGDGLSTDGWPLDVDWPEWLREDALLVEPATSQSHREFEESTFDPHAARQRVA